MLKLTDYFYLKIIGMDQDFPFVSPSTFVDTIILLWEINEQQCRVPSPIRLTKSSIDEQVELESSQAKVLSSSSDVQYSN